jgi:hypothetical protein
LNSYFQIQGGQNKQTKLRTNTIKSTSTSLLKEASSVDCCEWEDEELNSTRSFFGELIQDLDLLFSGLKQQLCRVQTPKTGAQTALEQSPE